MDHAALRMALAGRIEDAARVLAHVDATFTAEGATRPPNAARHLDRRPDLRPPVQRPLRRSRHVEERPHRASPGERAQDAAHLDLRKQLPPMSAIMTPAMTNVVTDGDGSRHHVIIVPDKSCVVNQGLSSTRGGQDRDHAVHRGRHRQGAPQEPGGLRGSPVARHHVGGCPRDLRGPDEEGARYRWVAGHRLLVLRSRRRGRWLREHVGHRQADVQRAADAYGADPQPAHVQLRVPCGARDGRGRAQQQLRGRRARRHDLRHRHQRLRDADQLLPRALRLGPCAASPAERSAPVSQEHTPDRRPLSSRSNSP